MTTEQQYTALAKLDGWESLGVNTDGVEWWMPPPFSGNIRALDWDDIIKHRRFLPNYEAILRAHNLWTEQPKQ